MKMQLILSMDLIHKETKMLSSRTRNTLYIGQIIKCNSQSKRLNREILKKNFNKKVDI